MEQTQKDKVNCMCGTVFYTDWPLEKLPRKALCPKCFKIHEEKLQPMKVSKNNDKNTQSKCSIS